MYITKFRWGLWRINNRMDRRKKVYHCRRYNRKTIINLVTFAMGLNYFTEILKINDKSLVSNIPHINFVQLIHVKIKMRKVVTHLKRAGIHKIGSLVWLMGGECLYIYPQSAQGSYYEDENIICKNWGLCGKA